MAATKQIAGWVSVQQGSCGQFAKLILTGRRIEMIHGENTQYSSNQSLPEVLLVANSPFRPDEIFTPYTSYSGSPVTFAREYVSEVKYRREKNDRIAALELKLADLEIKDRKKIDELEQLCKSIPRLESENTKLHEAMEISITQRAVIENMESENTKLQKEIESLKSKLRFYRDHDSENKELLKKVALLQSDKESLQTLNKDNVRIQSATSCDLRLRLQRLQDEIDQCKIENKKLRKDADKYKRIAEHRWELRQALLVDKNKEIAEITTSRDYLSRLRHTICPTKKYWIDEVNQKHSDKLKEVVKALGKKHVAKREKIIAEKEAFAKRVFELTEEMASLKQNVVSEENPCTIRSLKLQLAAEKRISQKYARDLHERDTQQSVLTAM